MSEEQQTPEQVDVQQIQEKKKMASPAEKVIAVLKSNKTLRNQLNTALDNIFTAANLDKLTLEEKKSILDAIKDLLVVDDDYTNIHVHWS